MDTETTKARILVVDRHAITRLGFSRLINDQADMIVVGEVGHADEVLARVAALHPDIVVFEVSARDGTGVELLQQLAGPPVNARVLAVSVYDERVYARRSLQAGAGGFVSKDEDCETILAALRAVLRGDTPAASQQAAQATADDDRGDLRSLLAKLTDRELEVFELLGRGFTIQQIASRLSVAANTVQSYRERIKKKLMIKNGTELTVCAAQWVVNQ